MKVSVCDGSFWMMVCEPEVLVCGPAGQLEASLVHKSFHVSFALSTSGLALSASSPVTVWNWKEVAVLLELPGGSVQRFWPPSQDAPPVTERSREGRMLPASSSPPAACTTSVSDVIVSVSGSWALTIWKSHFVC